MSDTTLFAVQESTTLCYFTRRIQLFGLDSCYLRCVVRIPIPYNCLNTPRVIADSTGTTVWRWDQGEPFGNDVPNNNPSGAGAFDFPLRFPGQYFDRETSLAYNVMRDYDTGLGRYVQSDPIGLDGGLNTY